jgi:hypothetical protein
MSANEEIGEYAGPGAAGLSVAQEGLAGGNSADRGIGTIPMAASASVSSSSSIVEKRTDISA